jgi:SAM-dependent methyltransferase
MIEEHYESLLGSRYTWMMGGIERCLADARGLLDKIGLAGNLSGRTVLDLGSGPGFHARALAERGSRVIAVDVSDTCLDELRRECTSMDVVALHTDLLDKALFEKYGPFSVVLCLGDTLAHLATHDDVRRLLENARALLSPGAILALEFREQSKELTGQDAVFTVRADRDRIMQCVLHFEPNRIWVTDVVHEWSGEAWTCVKSSYPKLRLTSAEIVSQAETAGLTLQLSEMRAGRRILVLRS